MKIKSYKKLKNNCYQISFVEKGVEDIILFADVILKYNLLIKKEITLRELQEIKKENFQMTCYNKALSFLAKKNRSKKEIHDYLKKENFKEQDIVSTIKLLEEKKIIDEDCYLRAFIHDQVYLGHFGPKRIMKKGIELGFLEEKIELCLQEIPYAVWKEKLEHLVKKKVNANHKDSNLKMKEKIVYSCMQEGYSKGDIVEILDGMDISSSREPIEKEAEKLYKRLSKKYQGKELFYQLKGKLMQKGFVSSAIDNVLEHLEG